MANTFRLKRSAVQGRVPTVGDLQLGELALNTFDGKLYAKKDDGTASVVEIGATIIPDGDKGDITVSSGGTIWTIDNGSVTNVKIASGITDDKLSTISTAGKVSGTAITSGNIGTSGSIATTSTIAVGLSSAAANTDLDVNGTYAGNIVAVAALDIDCSSGNYFTKTIAGNSTFTFSNVPASRAYSFTLEITHTSGTISWPASVKWPNDTAPTLTTAKTHVFIFVTDDGGTRWRGVSAINYVN